MRVLLTNDDGIGAEGLHALRRALLALDGIEVHVIAPDSNRSATARSITTRSPLWVQEIEFEDGTNGFATDGTPVDCVRFADLGLLGERPDLIVSGINHGVQPRRRHHLLGHGRRGARGDRPRDPRDRGLAAVDSPARWTSASAARSTSPSRPALDGEPGSHVAESRLPRAPC